MIWGGGGGNFWNEFIFSWESLLYFLLEKGLRNFFFSISCGPTPTSLMVVPLLQSNAEYCAQYPVDILGNAGTQCSMPRLHAQCPREVPVDAGTQCSMPQGLSAQCPDSMLNALGKCQWTQGHSAQCPDSMLNAPGRYQWTQGLSAQCPD